VSPSAPTATAPKPPSIGNAALVFLGVGPAMGAILFAVFFAVVGFFNMGLGAPLAALFYSAWILPWLYIALGVPFLCTGVVYAIAAQRYARPSLLMALMAGAGVFTSLLCLLYLLGWLATAGGLEIRNADALTFSKFLANLGTLTGAMAIGVVPSWWLVRKRGARLRWI
jgi:hypothetical protein